jgi:predicted Zn-dependent peptidase
MTWWAPDLDDPDRYALAVLNHLLGDGPSSALYEQIREERGLAYSVGSSVSAYTDISMLAVGCTMAPRHEATVRALIAEVTQKFCDGTISESDTSDAIGYLSGSLVMDLEDSGARMARLGSSELARGRLSELREAYERLKAVTPHDVKRVAHRVFSTPSVTSVVGPS